MCMHMYSASPPVPAAGSQLEAPMTLRGTPVAEMTGVPVRVRVRVRVRIGLRLGLGLGLGLGLPVYLPSGMIDGSHA